jgi:hypothetical protein
MQLARPFDQLMVRKTAVRCFMFALVFLSFTSSQACRYTVRELGFSDLAAPPYRLFICLQKELTAAQQIALTRTVEIAIAGSNLKVIFVNSQQAPQHPVLHFLSTGLIEYPCALLVSPDSTVRPFHFAGAGQEIHAFTAKTIRTALHSPARKALLNDAPLYHAAILLFGGKDANQTKTAATLIRNAVQQVEPVLPLMPKPAAKPPFIVDIPFSEQSRESVLMWSLGLTESAPTPQAIIVYGRGRKMGPVLRNDSLTTEAIYNFLLYVGADCECDMDRSYLNGHLIPLYWSSAARERVGTVLGFDPENPLVKMDMLNIARINSGRERIDLAGKNSPSRANDRSTVTSNTSQDTRAPGKTILCGMLALGVVVSLGALVILFIMKRRSSS